MQSAKLGMDGIILAGGRSSRMNGQTKALLPFGESAMLDRIISRMSLVCDSLVVVVATEEQYDAMSGRGVRTLIDRLPQQGPLAALHTALEQTEPGKLHWATACDMPFISETAAVWMKQKLERSGKMAIVPEIGGKLHPLHAIYRTECAVAAAEFLAEGRLGMMSLLDRIDFDIVKEKPFAEAGIDVRFAFNMNTPEQYEKALRMEARL
ncbi:molybdenum cofactor guanylyltransferase [Paenibacillus sp. NEAU-GSW1]|uniref:molybdenum cofactor guanylyltransferase n=1 Tax=Paenibacillus sp. NEAU-GSW1 TaxID=2682486 RepID=UPI001566258B|nr:molybdenum cofactor guanylyltransferase [Paenibacillus sp. NEAU-GSW1]